jgi:NDP-sugar pyrophosphorylase family protein
MGGEVKAVVLAGGEGTRLRPLTRHMPKPMVPVGRRACIDYAMASLVRAGVRDIIVTTAYMPDAVIQGLDRSALGGARVEFSIEREPLGTAGAVKKNEPELDGTFVVISGDVLADVDLAALVASHRAHDAAVTMALTTTPDPMEYGIVGLDGHDRIVRFKEKPRADEVFSDLINAGIYVLEPDVLAHVPPDRRFDFSKDLFPALLSSGHGLYGSRLEGLWMDIGRPADLIAANRVVVEREGAEATLSGVEVRGPVIIEEGAVVEEGASIEGPSMLLATSRVAAGATVVRSFVHPGVTVGEDASLEDCLLLRGSRVGEGAILLRSILDEGCAVGRGARLAESVLGRGACAAAGARLHDARVDGGAA